MLRPFIVSMAEVLKRLSRRSGDLHTTQLQAITGTPMDVPVPRKVTFMLFVECDVIRQWLNVLASSYKKIQVPSSKFQVPRTPGFGIWVLKLGAWVFKI
jgi:hypothetical protein